MTTSKKFIAFIAGIIFPFVIAMLVGVILYLGHLLFDTSETYPGIIRFVLGIVYLMVSALVWKWYQKESLKFFLIGETLVAIGWLIDFVLP